MIDKNGSGTIDFSEFKELCKYFGINLNDQALMELFAESDDDASGELAFPEFDRALTTLESKVGAGALQQMGLSTANIIMAVLVLAASLGSMLAFVFLGVQAFATGGAFNAIVNS